MTNDERNPKPECQRVALVGDGPFRPSGFGFPSDFLIRRSDLSIAVRGNSLPLFRTHWDHKPRGRSAELPFGTILPGETETPRRTGVRRSGSWKASFRFCVRIWTMNRTDFPKDSGRTKIVAVSSLHLCPSRIFGEIRPVHCP